MFTVEKNILNCAKTLGTASQNGVRVGGLVRMDFCTFSLFLMWRRGRVEREQIVNRLLQCFWAMVSITLVSFSPSK